MKPITRLLVTSLFWYFTVQLGGGKIYFAPIQFHSLATCEQGRLDAIADLNQLNPDDHGAYAISLHCHNTNATGGYVLTPSN